MEIGRELAMHHVLVEGKVRYLIGHDVDLE